MASKSTPLHVTYTFKPIGDNITELEFHEWVDDGELGDQFNQNTLEKLKAVMESGV